MRGIHPILTPEQRQHVRTIELRKRALTRAIAEMQYERKSLPTSAQLSTEFGCCVDTLRKAAQGRGYAHDAAQERA